MEPHSAHCRRRRPAGGGGLRDSGAGESEAVLLLVARVVPVLHEPGPRRALLRADPVRGPGRLGGRAATDRGDDLLHDSRDGDPLPAGAVRPARSLRVVPRRRRRARRAASLEGAIPQRAVLPDPGGALLRHLVLHRHRLLPRLARSGRDGRSRGVGPPAQVRRARDHRPGADPDASPRSTGSCRSRRTGTRRCSASISSRAPGWGSSRSSRSSCRRCAGRGCWTRSSAAEHLQDIGKFLFAFTAFWAYIAFSQFFLMWYGNMPEETIFYKARMEGSWLTVSLFLLFGHFFAPFFYLMGRSVKRNGATLAVGGAWILVMHFVDLTGRSCRRSIPRGSVRRCLTSLRSWPSADPSWRRRAG